MSLSKRNSLGYGFLIATICTVWVILFLRPFENPMKNWGYEDRLNLKLLNLVTNSNIEKVQTTTTSTISPKSEPTGNLQLTSIINLPKWYRIGDWGLTKNSSYENKEVTSRGDDKEEKLAWNNFFFGTTRGLMLEMGAMAGKEYSVSHFFEKEADWRVILIEGNPNLAAHLSENRPETLNFNVVVCEQPQEVHFMAAGSGGVDGIIEFMTLGFLNAFFKQLLTDGQLDWKKVESDPHVKNLQCVTLMDVFDPLKIYHINFFLLDTEGGELNILKAIDFSRITFDVICVETDRGTDHPEITKKYVDSVIDLVTSKGYILWVRRDGRNSWFVSPSFEAFKSEDFAKPIVN